MKAKMLKMAGVKTEKEFYKKFPTKESFMAKYGAEMRKDPAQWGAILQAAPAIISAFSSMANKSDTAETTTETTTVAPLQGSTLEKIGQQAPGAIGTGFKVAQAFKAQKEALRQAQQIHQITDAALMAQQSDNSREEETRQRQQMQVNPWDNIINPDTRLPSLGVGTNVLAEYGRKIPRRKIQKAQNGQNFTGMGKFLRNDAFGNFAQNAAGTWTNNSAGSQVGQGLADVTGLSKLPGGKLAGAALSSLGHLAFSLGDTNRTNRQLSQATSNINNMSGMNFGDFIQNQNKNFVKHGGKFYDQGGTLDGDLQILDGGTTQTLSYNPFSPGNGETAILKGNYHTEGGIDTAYGGKRIEAEHDEPIIQNNDESISIMGRLDLPKGFKQASEDTIGEKLSGKKFNTLIKSVGQKEEQQNKNIQRHIEDADNYTPLNPLDRISLNTLNLNIEKIAKPKLQALQDVKEGASVLQESINQTADEMNLDAQSLSLGKLKAKRGRKIGYYQDGGNEEKTLKKFKDAEDAKAAGYEPFEEDGKTRYRKLVKSGTPEETITNYNEQEIIDPADDPQVTIDMAPKTKNKAQDIDKYLKGLSKSKRFAGVSGEEMAAKKYFTPEFASKWDELVGYKKETNKEITPEFEEETWTVPGTEDVYDYADLEDITDPKKKKFPWENYLNMIPGLFDDSDAEDFNNRQLIPEMFALSNNQLEPVDAQKFTPRLDLPYDISYQEALNRNRANARAAERMAAYNPGMLSNLKAQEYQADQDILAQQFRANQAKKDAVYSGNRKILNEADLKNLAIMDQQYQRQAMAKSNTKATTQAALNSISDKVAKHSLENKTLRVWENMYKYRFDPTYRTKYVGDPVDVDNWVADSSGRGSVPPGYEISGYNKHGQPYFKPKSTKATEQMTDEEARIAAGGTPRYFGKNGMLVKKLKKFK